MKPKNHIPPLPPVTQKIALAKRGHFLCYANGFELRLRLALSSSSALFFTSRTVVRDSASRNREKQRGVDFTVDRLFFSKIFLVTISQWNTSAVNFGKGRSSLSRFFSKRKKIFLALMFIFRRQTALLYGFISLQNSLFLILYDTKYDTILTANYVLFKRHATAGCLHFYRFSCIIKTGKSLNTDRRRAADRSLYGDQRCDTRYQEEE